MASSTDSGRGLEPFSDAFIAVATEAGLASGSQHRVEAPEGSSQLLVRKSTCMASRLRSL